MAQPLEKKIENELGAMHLRILGLMAQCEAQQDKIAELEKKLATASKKSEKDVKP